MRLITLCENTSTGLGISAEWGLSILVDTGAEKILLDTGFSDSVVRNAAALGLDLQQVDKIVLSHGHCDHTGGLRLLLQAMGKRVDIIGHPEIWGKKYAKKDGNEYKYIGIPFCREELENLNASFCLSKQHMWLNDMVVTTGEVPMVTSFEQVDSNMYLKTEDGFSPDPLEDDQSLIIKSDKGLVIVLGCAHRGMVNTIIHAKKITGEERVHAVVGGTHLFRAGEAQLKQTIAKLKELRVEKIGVSHCTGLTPAMALAHEFSDNFFFNNAGTTIEV